MAEGIVKFFDNKKGYGFISADDDIDYFVHFSSIISDEKYKKLYQGDKVSFDKIDQPRGPSAINVEKLED
ncbi:cold shock domain-containing protein [Anaerococcus sp.]|uniref:cold-shock protein n=1 Tax=Anaerococcus sp. TaxID=1872515 RepID=UPI0028FF6633|nr:cold shock domain-containing protein [Anaerococcus sp.]MDU2598787.1 cold shock domain-containing protein [Anaerococcus sp.]MDU5230340.1 cold shock domain-containing protein [Anaerococcus sp.]